MDDRRLSARVVSAFCAVVIGLTAVWSALLALFSTSLLRTPDPARHDDPLPYPHDWGDVAFAAFSFATLALVAFGLGVLAIALGGVAVRGRAPAVLARSAPTLRRLAVMSVGCPFLLAFTWSLAERL